MRGAGEILRDAVAVLPFLSEVQFLKHRPGQLPDHLARLIHRQRGILLNQLGQAFEQLQIGGHFVAQAGPLHFHHHRFTTEQARPVHLGHGGSGKGLSVELGKHLVEPAPQILQHLVLQPGPRQG